jgi:hypothetical protein
MEGDEPDKHPYRIILSDRPAEDGVRIGYY